MAILQGEILPFRARPADSEELDLGANDERLVEIWLRYRPQSYCDRPGLSPGSGCLAWMLQQPCWKPRPSRSGVPASGIGSPWRRGLRRTLRLAILVRMLFENALFSYSLSIDSRLAGGAEYGRRCAALTEHGRPACSRLWRPEWLPRVPFRQLMRIWLARFHVTPRTELLSEIEAGMGLAGPTGAPCPAAIPSCSGSGKHEAGLLSLRLLCPACHSRRIKP